jgi:methionyl-tRNA synthetase
MQQALAQFLAQNQWVFILAAAWSLPWKGVSLWKAARNKQEWWFIVLLLVNTLGVLDALYIFVFSKKK